MALLLTLSKAVYLFNEQQIIRMSFAGESAVATSP